MLGVLDGVADLDLIAGVQPVRAAGDREAVWAEFAVLLADCLGAGIELVDVVVRDRTESERFKPFAYDELLQCDKVSLDLIWLRDESLEDSANLPPPDILAQEIVEDLEAALNEFAQIADSLRTVES